MSPRVPQVPVRPERPIDVSHGAEAAIKKQSQKSDAGSEDSKLRGELGGVAAVSSGPVKLKLGLRMKMVLSAGTILTLVTLAAQTTIQGWIIFSFFVSKTQICLVIELSC